jgi:biopolymer transport protein ExbD
MAVQLPGDDEGGGGIVAEINITPLTDVFLVLLIIFMVTSSVIANTGKKSTCPRAGGRQGAKAVNVTISTDGTIQVDGDVVKRDALQAAIKAALEVATDKVVILRGDKEIVYGEAVFVLDQAQIAGAEGFALATTKAKGIVLRCRSVSTRKK